jgi:hypothetical protein
MNNHPREFWSMMAKAADDQVKRLEKHLKWVKGTDKESEKVRLELIQDLASARDMLAYYNLKSNDAPPRPNELC